MPRFQILALGVCLLMCPAHAEYKTGSWDLPKQSTTISAPPPPDPYDPSIGWQTHSPSLICSDYFRVKDGETAAINNDRKWLNETGCYVGRGGFRLVLIEAPDFKVSTIWRARLYPPGEEGRNIYLRYMDAVNFAKGGIFKSAQDAEKAFAEMNRRYKRVQNREPKLAHRTIDEDGKKRLLIGPGSYFDLYYFCSAAHEDKETTEDWLARNKKASEEFSKTLQFKELPPPKLGPNLQCDVPERPGRS
jgi:hypothetical protein